MPPAFAVLVFALSSVVAGYIARGLLYQGTTILDYKAELITLFVIELIIAIGPLVCFVPLLRNAKRRALIEYGILGIELADQFTAKWLDGQKAEPRRDILEMPGPSTFADFTQVAESVSGLRPLPFERQAIIPIIVAGGIPLLGVLTIEMPVGAIVRKLFEIIL